MKRRIDAQPRRMASAIGVVLRRSMASSPSRPVPCPCAADACGPQPSDTPVTVASVSDTLEVRLADGRLLRLAGLDPPRATPADPALPAKARAALEAWVAGGAVTMRSLAAEPDRWNRTPVLLFHPAPTPVFVRRARPRRPRLRPPRPCCRAAGRGPGRSGPSTTVSRISSSRKGGPLGAPRPLGRPALRRPRPRR